MAAVDVNINLQKEVKRRDIWGQEGKSLLLKV